jgi:hypothetical protein
MKRKALMLACAFLADLFLVGAAAAASWSPAGNLTLARIAPQATLLADGRVLVTGGSTNVGNTYDTKLAEIYDPITNSWSPTGSTTNGRTDHTATRLADGRVLVAGGENANICTNDVTTELYDPTTGTWTATGSMVAARCCGASNLIALLSDGRVLAAGGQLGFANFTTPNGPFAEVYDPATGLWTPTGSMSSARSGHTLSLLPNGRVLAAGGYDGTNMLSSAELWDPATGIWSPTASLLAARGGHTATVLTNGKVLVATGYDLVTYLTSAELYTSLTYSFSGFFQPVDNAPTFNRVKAGSGIPVKFSLGGDQGLDVFAAGYPKSERVDRSSSGSMDDIELTVTTGGSSLSYNATADQYTYT